MTFRLLSVLAFASVSGLAAPALADTDLCTYGWTRSVRPWLSSSKGIGEVFCGKHAKKNAARTAAALAKALARDGYHVVTPPSVQEIPLGTNPSIELLGAMASSKCKPEKLKSVLAVCTTVTEQLPNEFIDGKPVPRRPAAPPPQPPSGAPRSGMRPAI